MTAQELTPKDLASYRTADRLRFEQEQRELTARKKRAWELARCAALLLRDRFGATRVMVFGSLVHTGCFTPWSDVDIAAWGIRPHDTFRAVGMVMELGDQIEVNLVDAHTCSSSLLMTIEREGSGL